MKSKLLLTLLSIGIFCIQTFAQSGETQKPIKSRCSVSGSFTTIINSNDVEISVRVEVKSWKDNSNPTGVSVYWKIKNKINKPIWLEGDYIAYGSPLPGLSKNKEGSVLPLSKVEPYKTEIYPTYASQLISIDAISVELNHIYKKSDVKSGSAN